MRLLADELAVGIDDRRIGTPIGDGEQLLEEVGSGRIVVLPIAEERAGGLLQQPAEVADPVEAFGLDDHAEAAIGEEGTAGLGADLVIAIDRDDDLEVGERLRLEGAKRLGDEVLAVKERHANSDASSQSSLRKPVGAIARRPGTSRRAA